MQELYKENKTDDIKNDISLCLKKAIDAKKKPTTQAKPAEPVKPKVEEVKLKAGEARSVKIEECSDDSDDDAEAKKKIAATKKGKTNTIDQEVLLAAKAKAAEIDKQ